MQVFSRDETENVTTPRSTQTGFETSRSRFDNTIVRWWSVARALKCPDCESTLICRSVRHGTYERMLKSLGIVPWRCMACRYRFFALRRR